jgi:hypothetical protein
VGLRRVVLDLEARGYFGLEVIQASMGMAVGSVLWTVDPNKSLVFLESAFSVLRVPPLDTLGRQWKTI